MLNRLIYVLFALLLTSICQQAYAFGMPSSQSFPQIIAQSQIVVVASLEDYRPDISLTDLTSKLSVPTGAVGPATFIDHPMRPAGQYTFHVISLLKGSVASLLSVHLPYVLALYYGGFDYSIRKKNKFILFLTAGADGKLTPTDVTIPFVPVSDSVVASENHYSNTEESVYALMLSSCSDAAIRRASSYVLRAVVNPMIVTDLFQYINDPDFYTRGYVLTCMAANQQVSAIPCIAALEEQGSGSDAVTALGHFENPQALPYLNPLLLSSAYYVRMNAMFSIDNLADRTSSPYLVLAVRDPDEQNIIPQSAYGLLHQLNPSLGEAFGNNYFAQHRAVETKKLYAWWSDELLGKHLKPGEHPAIPAVLPPTPALLNPLLFVPDTATRRAVAAKLARIGDKGSIPYLILALQDPDAQQPEVSVSYVAYKTLHRLIPALGAAQDSGKFTANHAAATQPIYDWWRDELLGKHLPK